MQTPGLIVYVFLGWSLTACWGQPRYFISTIAGSNPLGDNGPATHALLWNPNDVAADAAANVYIADTANNRIRKVAAAGTITTLACTGVAGYTGDGALAAQAECNSPGGIAVDAAGNVYFSDSGNQRVRRIGLDGKISLVAGDGSASFAGDGGPATVASLNDPVGLAVDSSGDLYIADANNHRIRRITRDGNINTIAGTGSSGFSGDTGLATQAKLNAPHAVNIDSQGRVLIADTQNSRIRRFVPGGIITTIAGSKAGFGGDNSLATAAYLSKPDGVTVDRQGILYISDTGNQRIRVVTGDGIITTIAGSIAGFRGDATSAAGGWLNNPLGIATDGQNIYIADSSNDRVRAIFPSHIINTIAGSGHYSGDNGPALSAVMTNPSFVAMDNPGNLFISDQDNHVVRMVDITGKITTIAGTGVAGNLGDGGPALSAQLNSPQGLAVDRMGNVYVVDANNATIRMITPGGAISKIAGGGKALNDGGPAQAAKLNSPHGMALDGPGNIYVADSSDNRVRLITTDGIIHTLIGDGTAQDNGDGGPASAAELNRPWDVKVAGDGTVYIAEFSGGRVRSVNPAGIAGTVGFLNGNNTGIAIDTPGSIIVAGANQILSMTPSGANTRIAGDASRGFAGDGGPGLNALLNSPVGVVTDTKGNIYFCDQANNRVRKLSPDVASQVILVSGNQQTAPLGVVLPLPLIVQVNGETGLPLAGVTVAFAITSGGGTLGTMQALTGSDGQARVTLTLPLEAGSVRVDATVTGFPPVGFTATAVNMPGSISILNGNNQTGLAGATLPQTLAVTVLGLDQKPFAGIPVTFVVTGGSAKLNPTTVQTAADGSAATQVTLGATAGPVTVSATVTGLTPVKFSLSEASLVNPQIFAGGVVGAGLSTPPVQNVSPNGIVSIFGNNFAPAGTSRSVTLADLVNGMVPTNLAGVCVLFGTLRAPVFLVTPGQLNVRSPLVTTSGMSAVQVITNCDTPNQAVSSTLNVAVQQASPEFFYSANNVAAVDGITGAVIGPGFASAYPGEIVTIYCTGLGLTTPAFAAGQLPPGGAQVNDVTVTIDGTPLDPADLQYAGVTPLNAGLYQLNIVLPTSLTNGDHVLSMTISGQTSPAGHLSVGQVGQ